ncbi:hypothetical protein MACH10_09990 [Thalassospira tepidiphila]|jgi:hypothetical protein|nr:hypothetical protein MACH10_09990 [Thalassospira tepidiphila]
MWVPSFRRTSKHIASTSKTRLWKKGTVYCAWDGRLDMPDQVFALLNMAAGLILGMIKDAFQFEFGSSRGSKEKDLLKK